jgi:hypothetical protein
MDSKQIVLETLERVNAAFKSDSNALTVDSKGHIAPERAYLELLRDLLKLTK